jgi:hypothetical protein
MLLIAFSDCERVSAWKFGCGTSSSCTEPNGLPKGPGGGVGPLFWSSLTKEDEPRMLSIASLLNRELFEKSCLIGWLGAFFTALNLAPSGALRGGSGSATAAREGIC